MAVNLARLQMPHAGRPLEKPASGFGNLILAESVRSQYRGLRTSCINSLVMASLLMAILFRAVPVAVALGWLTVMYLQVLAHYLLLRAYEKANPAPEDAPRWGRYAIAGAAVSGLIWGAGGLLLFAPGLLEYQLLLLFVLIGVVSSAVYASASYMPAFYAFAVPAIVPVGINLLVINDAVHVVLGLLTEICVEMVNLPNKIINTSGIEVPVSGVGLFFIVVGAILLAVHIVRLLAIMFD